MASNNYTNPTHRGAGLNEKLPTRNETFTDDRKVVTKDPNDPFSEITQQSNKYTEDYFSNSTIKKATFRERSKSWINYLSILLGLIIFSIVLYLVFGVDWTTV